MDAYINPLTADYVVTGGVPVRDPMAGLANAVYLRLMTPLGSYWADPTLGSRLHELMREKDLARMAILAKQYAESALNPIVIDGRANSIAVSVTRMKDDSGAGRHQLSILVVAASGERKTFQFPLKVM
jgi:phage gp46-like protein